MFSDDAVCTRGDIEMREFTGIDVSKEKLDLCWLRDAVSGKRKTKVFKNQPAEFKNIKKWFTENLKTEPQNIVVTIEPTNVYHEPLCYFLHDAGFRILLVNTGKAKKHAESLGMTHKTDKLDAFILAKYGEAQKDRLSLWEPEAPAIRELKELTRRLGALEKDLQREENRRDNYALTKASKDVLKSSEEVINYLEEQIEKLIQKIDDHIDSNDNLKKNRELLQSIKGVGPVISRELTYLFAAKNFKTARQAAAYLGVIPKLVTSGKFKGKSMLTKVGPGRIRSKLYMAAVVASQHNPDIKHQKERLLQNGKCKMEALCAAMRKLVQICFGVVKHQSEYQPQIA